MMDHGRMGFFFGKGLHCDNLKEVVPTLYTILIDAYIRKEDLVGKAWGKKVVKL